MSIFERESSLLAPVQGAFRRRGYRWQGAEVQFFEYSMDVYGYSNRTGDTIAVELKLKKWMRALEQAIIYQLCADYAYVALPENSASRVDKLLFQRHGIGIISVLRGPRCKVVLPAQQSLVVEPQYKKFYVKLMQESNHGGSRA